MILEPSAGAGSLVWPVLQRAPSTSHVVCVEIDRAKANQLRRGLGRAKHAPTRCTVINGDFLSADVHRRVNALAPSGYDCVVMNPPFLSKRLGGVRRQGPASAQGAKPLELQFIEAALHLLSERGTLLSILPWSVVAGADGREFRQRLQASGCIRMVHELPKGTFFGIDEGVFLLVLTRGMRTTHVSLRNHRLYKPEAIDLRFDVDDRRDGHRLDFAYHDAAMRLQAAQRRAQRHPWVQLGDVATVSRGLCRGGTDWPTVLHTSSRHGRFWHSPADPANRPASSHVLTSRDILMARVGRNLASSAGILVGPAVTKWSDCVLRIRPRGRTDRSALLLALRVVLNHSRFTPLVVRGLAARYTTPTDLEALRLPLSSTVAKKSLLSDYREALARRDAFVCELIEDEMAELLDLGR